jgi:hypothetical protein
MYACMCVYVYMMQHSLCMGQRGVYMAQHHTHDMLQCSARCCAVLHRAAEDGDGRAGEAHEGDGKRPADRSFSEELSYDWPINRWRRAGDGRTHEGFPGAASGNTGLSYERRSETRMRSSSEKLQRAKQHTVQHL